MKIGNFDSLLEDHLEDAKIIAIPHQRDEEEMEEDHTDAPLPEVLPILPLKNTVLFPGVIMPISIKREASLELINDAKKEWQSFLDGSSIKIRETKRYGT